MSRPIELTINLVVGTGFGVGFALLDGPVVAGTVAAAALGSISGNLLTYLLVDPLVIDLDGDGAETIFQDVTTAYFDLNSDVF